MYHGTPNPTDLDRPETGPEESGAETTEDRVERLEAELSRLRTALVGAAGALASAVDGLELN